MRQPTSAAKAEPTTEVAWSTDLMRSLSRPGPAGAEVAQACVACHGERGIAPDPDNPNLAGQSAVAIYKQLHDYKSGSRVHELMTPLAQGLDEQADHRGGRAFRRQPTGSTSIRPPPRWATRTSCGSSSGAIRRAACRPAIPATARLPAVRSRRRPWRSRTGNTSPRRLRAYQERRAPQRHLHPHAQRRRQAHRPRDRPPRRLLRDDAEGVTIRG